MTEWLQTLLTVFGTLIASSGFWAFITKIYGKKSATTKLLIGLGHDRIIYLGTKYLERGYITPDEYENLNDYLFVPYSESGGNGSAALIIEKVRKLPPHPVEKGAA